MRRRAGPACIIFDCDGVLVDSEPIYNRVLVECLAEIGVAITMEESMERFMGRSLPDCLALVTQERGSPPPDWFAERLRERSATEIQAVQAVPGVASAIAAIDLPRCVASSSGPPSIERVLSLTGLLPHFAGRIFSAHHVARGKPHPDLFLHAAATMGVAPAACVVVEDSIPGVTGARAAGMTVFGYAAGPYGERLAGAGARVFTDMAHLPGLVAALERD